MDFSARLSAVEAVKLFKEKSLSIIDYNQMFIDRIKAIDDKIGAWAYFDEEKWMSQCRELSEKEDFGPHDALLGIPVGIKDIFNTKQFATSMGSPLWEGFTPGNDARVVHNILFNNGVIAGKTVTAEFAVHAPNNTRNPWNLEHSPGTSSSGSAAAVAAGMVPMTLGTQTAGSVIRPASYSGIYGYKPSFGTIPRTGMLKTTDTLDAVGLFARTIEDCRLLFDVIRVHGLDYPIVHQHLQPDAAIQQKIGKTWKVGFITDQHWTIEHVSPYALKAFTGFIDDMKGTEIEVVNPRNFSPLFNDAHTIQETIYHKALSYYFKKEFEAHTLISEVMYQIINEGRAISTEQYLQALSSQTQLAHEIDQVFGTADILIALSTAGVAPMYGTAIDPPDTCLIWSLCGLPVINVPLFDHNGLPFGIQIIGRKYADYKLLQFAQEMIQAEIFPAFSKIALMDAVSA